MTKDQKFQLDQFLSDPNPTTELTGKELREVAVRMLLASINEDFTREGLEETPKRVARMYDEIFAGYGHDAKELLGKTFSSDGRQDMVIVGPIQFYSHCEHHMVPFHGEAYIGYIPNGRVVGISKLARLVDMYAKRVQIQERLTYQIADAIEEHLHPFGVAVMIQAEHMCMSMRGVKKPGTKTTTASIRGIFKLDEKARAEFNAYIEKAGK